MTQSLASLDAGELTQWLTHLTQTVDRSLRDPVRSRAAASLREGLDGHDKVALPVLLQLAFLADCLHVAHLAIHADGRVEPDELDRVADLVGVAASKYCFALPAYESFGDGAATQDEVARFLGVHREDPGPFGFRRSKDWRGLLLARLVERSTRNAAPLQDHERMLVRIMEAVFAGRTTATEQAARRRLRDLFEQPGSAAVDTDPRAVAFCRSDGPEIFSSIAHGAQFHERDPFDVEAIHADARGVFHQQVDRATTPEQAQRGQGRMLLVLGESGAGKTHLLRSLRAQVHSRRLGYVGYLQLTSEVDDYARYVLRSLIDSLERPYDAPSLAESSLMYLSDGLVEGREAISPDDLEQLRTADLAPAELEQLVGRLVDRVVRSEGLERLEVDLVQALLLLQRRDPALQRRIIRFLRCDTLNQYDRQLLGGLGPRDQADDPLRTIKDLATVMHELQLAALVVVVDQVEEAVPDGHTVTRLQQALDSMRAIADAVPSAVIVISCLEDVYDAVKPRLLRTLRDRLERDETRLTSQRQPDEIEQMLVRRLEYLYSFFDVAWRDDDPLYPFTPAQIAAVSQLRTRDCLAKFREFHNACIAARAVVSVESTQTQTAPPGPPPPPEPPHSLDKLWNETLAATGAPPEGDAEVLALVADALRGAATERGLALDVRAATPGSPASVIIEGAAVRRRLVAVCNNPPQRGSFGAQLASLRGAATKVSAIPVALRNGDFKFQPKTKMAQHVGDHVAAGGLAVPVAESHLRVAMAARTMSAANPAGYADWRRAKQPLGELAFVRQVLELDRETAPVDVVPPVVEPSPPVVPPAGPAAGAKEAAPRDPQPKRDSAPVIAVHAHAVRLGVVDSMRGEPIFLPLEDIKTHVAFLGSTGSGKTTAALSVVEQLLERGVSVLLVDRKGDLARYVSEAWWSDPAAPPAERDRKLALRKRIEIALFTPGNAHGRPLRLPLVPSLADVKPQDREQLARYAADGLGAMMGYGKTAAHRAKSSILQCAITLHGEERDITLDLLLETIDRPDPELLHLVGALQRHFAALSEDLQTLRIQRGSLLSGDGEPLEMDVLLPPPSAGRPRLSIINTSALTEVPVLQFWVSRLLVELSRLGRKRPSQTLQAAAFFDEADTYVPATSSPPTKEPMFDLLRRSRSTGIGVLLATQNPGDFDYKARDNISTWLLGKIAQERAIEKMRNLIGNYPDVGPRLASQRTGSFFLLTGTTKRELRADRSLMETVQLPENEVADLARQTRAAGTTPGRAGA
jgi:DNA helicase HerA-like ATPase/energy-coupling factor transporter ATP-binding protein EcfA2